MKLVFAVDKLSFNDKDHIGVVKKVESQLRLFEKNGIDSSLCQYTWEGGYPQIEIDSDTDILYFRRIESSVKLIVKLRELKRKSPKLRIIMEIPTYPFAAEERGSISLKKKVNRCVGDILLKRYVDRLVLISQQDVKKLYGIPAFCVKNGVDFDMVPLREIIDDNNVDNEIHMICVSGCYFWHGYERLIEGMHKYYQRGESLKKVVLHFVGEGSCLNDYISLAERYGLKDDKIIFYGVKSGAELDEIYNKCDIAIECLGSHRKNIFLSSSLKSREYAAKGLPMVAANAIDINVEKTEKYFSILPADETAIDVEGIIKFYHGIYDGKRKKQVATEIRNEFFPLCDWNFVYKPVIDYMVGKEV